MRRTDIRNIAMIAHVDHGKTTLVDCLLRQSGDMAVNPTREKKLTNMRASGTDKSILLKPPRLMSLETALEYIEEDELVEVTPSEIRIRKRILKDIDRRRASRQSEAKVGSR